ncbi:YolD-like family protein [Paenibacillus marinisediminis]
MKKLSGNGLWESSRMMLFEHRDAILEKKSQKSYKARPSFDEQFWESLIEKLSDAYQAQLSVQVRIYGKLQDDTQTGIISHIDPITQRIKLNGKWIRVTDIVEVSEE